MCRISRQFLTPSFLPFISHFPTYPLKILNFFHLVCFSNLLSSSFIIPSYHCPLYILPLFPGFSISIVYFLSFFLSFFLGSGPEVVDDLCFHTYGEFSPPPPSVRTPPFSSEAQILVPRPKSQSRGPNYIHKAQILASRPKSQP